MIMSKSWPLGAILALCLHVGSAAALLLTLPAAHLPADEDFGALVIDLAALPVAQDSEVAEAAADEDREERVATRDLTETLSTKRENDLPTEQAAPDKPEDDSLHFAQERTKKEEEKPAEEQQVSEAMQKQEAQQASQRAAEGAEVTDAGEKPDEARAAELGSRAEAERRALEAWQKALMTHLARYRRYPEKARAAKAEGEALVRFSLNRQGQVIERAVTRTAGSPLLDAEALEMLARSGALPAPPAHLKGESIELTVPVRFRLKG